MRFALAILAVLVAAQADTVLPADRGAGAMVMAEAVQQPPVASPAETDPDPRRAAGWGAARIWIGIGLVTLVLLVVAIVLSARGGGRTVLKE